MLQIPHSRTITNMNKRTRERGIKAHNGVESIPKTLLSGFTVQYGGKDSWANSGFGRLHLCFELFNLNLGSLGGTKFPLLKIREYLKIMI